MRSYFYRMRQIFGAAFLALSVLALTESFYPIHILDIQIGALAQRVFVDFSVSACVVLLMMLFFTFVFGRFYCSTLCPLGLFQEAVMTVIPCKQKRQKNYIFKYFIAVIVWGTLSGGTAFVLRWADPYTYFDSALTLSTVGGVAGVCILILTFFKGRFFCTNICPVGTVLGVMARFSKKQIYIDKNKCVSCGLCALKCPSGCIDIKAGTVDNEMCVKCLKCLTICRLGAIRYGKPLRKEVAFNPTRRNLIKGISAGLLFAGAVKGGIKIKKEMPQKDVLLPPGAMNSGDFVNRCLNCNLCVANCPQKIIQKADGLFDVVHLDYSKNGCRFNCHKCSSVCPSGALRKMTLEQKQHLQIGMATVDKRICIKCGACVDTCPRKAIHRERGQFPMIDASECIGCGRCKKVCPAKAIGVFALKEQHEIKGV